MRDKRFFWKAGYSIRFFREGCRNRPFFHLGVIEAQKRQERIPMEVFGSFDMFANDRNERLLAVDCDRLTYWVGKGAKMSRGVSAILGR